MVLVLRLLLVVFVIRSVFRLVRGIAEGMQAPRPPRTPAAVPLVRDPVCGTYVVRSSAFTSGSGPQTRFFCSERCRRAHAMKIAQ